MAMSCRFWLRACSPADDDEIHRVLGHKSATLSPFPPTVYESPEDFYHPLYAPALIGNDTTGYFLNIIRVVKY